MSRILLARSRARCVVQRFGDGAGIARRYAEERQRRTVGRPSALLPVAQRGHTDSDHEGKFSLRGLEHFANALHIGRAKRGNPAWLLRAAPNAPCLPDARDQLLECRVFHVSSFRTSVASVLGK